MSHARRPSRRTGRILMAIAVAAMASAAYVLAPFWQPYLATSEEDRIAAERQQRRLRVSLGMRLPGQPDLTRLPQRLAEHGLMQGAPVLIRVFKSEFELELWMKRDGRYHRFATYPICTWSGAVGPKLVEGDRQAPEGFYTVEPTALNPNSQWYRSFNLGYPNAYDRAKGRTGSFLMVHGGCASIGCFAMTNAQMDEIWRLITAAFTAGQKRFQVQVYPFRMSEARLAQYGDHASARFWQALKAGYDAFETSFLPPRVMVCRGEYRFAAAQSDAGGDPTIEVGCPAGGPQT